ncbi:hypothetical protein RDI58_011210 [Solanum bulbocastanum]|uniref:Yippee domain-containing protein n=1 Tax=Solanum bulbocastanum TaxID=147425 RepID=A0AAN8YG24_SOLBU
MTTICDHTNKSFIPSNDNIYCRTCRNPVARVHDFIYSVIMLIFLYTLQVHPGGIFSRVYNVLVSDDVNYHFGSTIAKTYYSQCGTMIEWKFIEVPRWYKYVREERFISKLNGVSLLHLGANEQNADQDGDSTDQDENANEQNSIHKIVRVDTNEYFCGRSVATFWNGVPLPHLNEEQDLDANEQNVHQDGDATTIRFLLFLSVVTFWNGVPLPHISAEQDLGANEQNADQDGGDNEQNHDSNGGTPMN